MMNFRQRMGWLGVLLFLLLSALLVYYVFEVQSFSLEHVQRGGGRPVSCTPDQLLFLFLFSCTRADPRAVGYCVLPVCLALLCSRHAARKPSYQRGPPLIDT
ncbi:hypothetical protein PBY51_018475 [Eleginops maclovinus]|uniref:Lysosomal enzyme trafficking factor n=1 Tax=Eleginops maclovinus TaxID=56733 RepID=A0AAN7Y7I2_ELEMC|nr:hypothetical protein PBY51_018475 [Eleginops maclovinus]